MRRDSDHAAAAAAFTALLFLAGCRSGPAERESVAAPAGPQQGPRDSVESFVTALNTLDARGAAAWVDWDLWVAADPRLAFLVEKLRKESADRPPGPEALDGRPLAGSSVTLREILEGPPAVLARAARERFEHEMVRDLGPGARTTEARIVSWHEDRRETAATLVMPNGEVVEMLVLGSSGRYRLVPRW